MASAKIGLTAAALVSALTVAGCSSTRVGAIDSGPAPLTPAPAGVVENRPLPPPAAPDQFPKAPEGQGTQVASLPPAAPPANAPDVTIGSVAGVWNVSVAGSSCRVATPQTKFGAGYRAGPLKCPAPADGIRSWNVSGKQLTLFDDGGSPIAKLYASGVGRFDGQTTSGQPISLSR
ncbi:hypothetical protein BZU93_28105 [Salmonella enterica subsp. enterica]|nr:hypothetical protein [Salmonella enterica subsp. enterica serovar Enteritidis]